MISERLKKLCGGNSAIRAMFEEGNRLASIYGRENVYDFSLGNPNFPAPAEVNSEIKEILSGGSADGVHAYMSNSGYPDVRRAVAENLNKRFGMNYNEDNIVMSVGAAGGMNCILQSLLNAGDEVLVFAPYFLEYGNYVSNFGGVLKSIPAEKPSFMPSAKALEEAVTEKTKAVIINNPNNPTGVIYGEEIIKELAAVLEKKQIEVGHPIYIISDEPYRELAYDGVCVPYIPTIYKNTLVGYSWSKSLSLPGERIGYVAITPSAEDSKLLFDAISISTRILGFVNAPSLIQKTVAQCLDCRVDVGAYDKNRKALYKILTDCGFECVMPEGAFYLFMKTLCDDKEFAEKAKAHRILLVPGSSFACPNYVRIAYCVSMSQIERSKEAFEALAKEF